MPAEFRPLSSEIHVVPNTGERIYASSSLRSYLGFAFVSMVLFSHKKIAKSIEQILKDNQVLHSFSRST